MKIRRYFHGWLYFFHVLWGQYRKRKRGIHYPWRQMIYVAKCGRFIASQQHRPELNPANKNMLVRKPKGKRDRS